VNGCDHRQAETLDLGGPAGGSAFDALAAARRRGVQVTGTARQVTDRDLHYFDYVIAMDGENYAELDQLKAAADGTARIHRLREWDPQGDSPDVPDPYYGGSNGFERVHEIVERCCSRLLDSLLDERVPARR
jgi:protein-tyrosine phosphatase